MNSFSDVKTPGNTVDNFSNGSQKKVLHFSDGTLEVDDDTDAPLPVELDSKSVPVDSRELTWVPWMWYVTLSAGSKALEVCDYLGEYLASFFGITTPKYQFEINEYNRIKKEEEEEAKNDLELGNWKNKYNLNETENEMGAVSTGPKVSKSYHENNIRSESNSFS